MRMKSLAMLAAAALFAVLAGSAAVEAQRVSIGIDLPVYPQLVLVPNYPVYYAPGVRANYFFYDGLYWVFNVEDGQWYSSSWYNGPWVYVEPAFVPQGVLVVPYRYYRVRPAYWSGWVYDAPPRWGYYWGPSWEARRRGWDHWDRNHRWVAAPLPLYQRNYARGRYPSLSQQVIIHNERYHYKVQDVIVREHQSEIINKQAQGGFKAKERAERASLQSQDKGQGQDKGPRQDKSLRQEKGQGRDSGQGQDNKGRGQDKGASQGQDNNNNKGQRQNRAQSQGQNQNQNQGQGQQFQNQNQGQGQQHQDRSRQVKAPPQHQEKAPHQGRKKGQEG